MWVGGSRLKSDWYVVLEEAGVLYRVCKIFTYADFGLGVAMPYHYARDGTTMKIVTSYANRGVFERRFDRDVRATFATSDRIKLSLHLDGFVQFSAAGNTKIRSGRDPRTGDAKGLGLLSQPLTAPIQSGPTFGATVWGLSDYERVAPSAKLRNSLVFRERDYKLRAATETTWNGYLIETFLFPKAEWLGVSLESSSTNAQLIYRKRMWQFEKPGEPFAFKVIPTGVNPFYFMGVIVSRSRLDVPISSGYILSGPSGNLRTERGEKVGDALVAFVPSLSVPNVPVRTLHYRTIDG